MNDISNIKDALMCSTMNYKRKPPGVVSRKKNEDNEIPYFCHVYLFTF